MLHSRKCQVPRGIDEQEFMFHEDFSDGFPVVVPTPDRVSRMLQATDLPSDYCLGKCAPSYAEVTVEKAAIACVMAGCLPDHFAIAIAAIKGMLTDTFNLHGVHATTMGATPCIIVNGPVRTPGKNRVNSEHGCLGSGSRANACIGRALKLVLYNIGGGRLKGSESTTIGSANKFTCCLAENEEVLVDESGYGWEPYHTGMNRKAYESTSTVVAVTGGPTQLVDVSAREPDELLKLMSRQIVHAAYSTKFALLSTGVLVIGPEHYLVLKKKFKTRESFKAAIWQACNAEVTPYVGDIIANAKVPESFGSIGRLLIGFMVGTLAYLLRLIGFPQTFCPKFETVDSLQVVVAGGPAGKFSAFMPGFGVGFAGMPSARMSMPVTTPIELNPHSLRLLNDPRREPPSSSSSSSPSGPLEYLYPGAEARDDIQAVKAASRTGELQGTVGLMDISKGRGKEFLDRIEELMAQTYPTISVKRFIKPTFSRPAPAELRQEVVCGALEK